MRANKAGFALTLSLAIVLAACGGGGGGGGRDDVGGNGGGGGNSSGGEPVGFGDFDGSFTLYGRNEPGEAFDRTFPADFVDGRATVEGVATKFDYPLQSQGSGCYFQRGDLDHCVERAEGHVLALCGGPDEADISVAGIRSGQQSALKAVNLPELTGAARVIGSAGLQFEALTCSGTLDDTDTVTIFENGTARQGATAAGNLDQSAVNQLFSSTGVVLNNARVGQRAYSYESGGVTTYYIVNFAALTGTTGSGLPPVVFVSVN